MLFFVGFSILFQSCACSDCVLQYTDSSVELPMQMSIRMSLIEYMLNCAFLWEVYHCMHEVTVIRSRIYSCLFLQHKLFIHLYEFDPLNVCLSFMFTCRSHKYEGGCYVAMHGVQYVIYGTRGVVEWLISTRPSWVLYQTRDYRGNKNYNHYKLVAKLKVNSYGTRVVLYQTQDYREQKPATTIKFMA